MFEHNDHDKYFSIKLLFLIGMVVYLIWKIFFSSYHFEGTHYITSVPQQEALTFIETQPILLNDTTILTPLYHYKLQARLLSKEEYSEMDSLAPFDFAFGWGDSSKSDILNTIRITQSNRWYHFWINDTSVISVKHFQNNSANTHIIPANDTIKQFLEEIKVGDFVELEGKLVNINNSKFKFQRNSSVTRTDTGAGSCEIMYVEKVSILPSY